MAVGKRVSWNMGDGQVWRVRRSGRSGGRCGDRYSPIRLLPTAYSPLHRLRLPWATARASRAASWVSERRKLSTSGVVTLKVTLMPPPASARTPRRPSGPRARGRMASAPRSPATPMRLPASGKAMGLAMTPPCGERHRQALADHAAVREGDAADAGRRATRRCASVSGLKAALSAISERRSASERSTSPKLLPLRARSTKDWDERAGEARAGLGDVGELRLQRARVGVDGDGEGGGGVVGHGEVVSGQWSVVEWASSE